MAKVMKPLELFLAIYGCTLYSISGQLCSPCEENKQCTISYTIKLETNAKMYVSWESESNEVMTCNSFSYGNCFVYPQYNELISFSTQETPGFFTTNFIFLNTSRISKTFLMTQSWKLYAHFESSTPQLLFTCDVKIFRKPTNVYCAYESGVQGLQINCTGELLYPEMVCTIKVQLTKNAKQQYLPPVYNSTRVEQDPVYYNTSCLAILPCELLGNELIMLEVNFFPENIESCEHFQCGENYVNSFKIDYFDNELKQYSLTNTEGTKFNVYCQLDNLSDINSTKLIHYFNTTQLNKIEMRTTDFQIVIGITVPVVIGVALFLIFYFLQRSFRIRRYNNAFSECNAPFIKNNYPFKQHLSRVRDCGHLSKHDSLIPCKEFMKDKSKILKDHNLSVLNLEEYISECIQLTVRLKVTSKTSRRPDSASNHVMNPVFGSGIVTKVKLAPQTPNVSKKTTWLVYIKTSTKVVSGQEEAKCTTAKLFYHDTVETHVKKLRGVELLDGGVDGESCILVCQTADEELCNTLNKALSQQKSIYRELQCNQNIVVLISHPHGLHKCITFGSCTYEKTTPYECTLNRLQYRTTTCPGSVGAPVLKLNQRFSNIFVADFPVHIGANTKKRRFSSYTISSTTNSYSKKNQSQPKTPEVRNKCDKTTTPKTDIILEFAEVECNGACSKTNDHNKFIQINDFTLEQLPAKYQNQNVLDYIKIVSELTGRVEVDLHTNKKRNMRTGTGTIVSVVEVSDGECPCPKCEESPSNVFYLVKVLTAHCVVSDDTEARQSFFRIDNNDDESNLHKLYGLKVADSDNKNGRSLVEFVTHESQFGSSIYGMLKKLYSTEKKIPECFRIWEDNMPAVIVSHLYGSPKTISIGECLNREFTARKLKYRYFYNTDTCQGSSGAAVIVLGDMLPRVVKRQIQPHIHHTTDSTGLGASCFDI